MSFLQAEGAKIHFQKLGTGPATVVFLHGLVMDNLSSWFFTLANPASQIAQVLVYDLRGHGFSDRPSEGYTIERHLEDLKALIDEQASGGPVILVGNSFGGLLAINFAVKYPELVRGLILVDAQVNDIEWREGMLRSLSLKGEERDQMIGENFKNWLGRNSRRKSNRLAENAQELLYQTSLLSDLRGSDDLSDQELQSVTAPCYAIYGANSDIISTARRLQLQLPHCELTVFDGCTHSVLWEKTEEIRSLILEQIAQLGQITELATPLSGEA